VSIESAELFVVNDKRRIGYQFVRKSKTPNGYSRWRFLAPACRLDALVVARMDLLNVEVMDYYVLTPRHLTGDYINLRVKNPALSGQHHLDLDSAIDMALGFAPSRPSIAGHA
jgi:hypothetical protein